MKHYSTEYGSPLYTLIELKNELHNLLDQDIKDIPRIELLRTRILKYKSIVTAKDKGDWKLYH